MAGAEELFHEAQHEFNSITYETSRKNRRHAKKARSLSKKILARYPGTPEAQMAASFLWRLGDETYAKQFQHQHTSQDARLESSPDMPHRHELKTPLLSSHSSGEVPASGSESAAPAQLDWARLISWLFGLPKALQVGLVAGAVFLFSVFGFLILLPLVVFILATGPLRSVIGTENQRQLDSVIAGINRVTGSNVGG